MILDSFVKIVNFITSWIEVPVFNLDDIQTFFSPLGLIWNFVDKTLLLTCILFLLNLELGVLIWKIVRK